MIYPTGVRSALELIQRVHRFGEPVVPEYPLIVRDESGGEIVALEEYSGGGIRSACATLIRDLHAGSGQLRVGMIGSVSTDPKAQGRGFATALLTHAEERLTKKGCAMAVLWAGDEEFYERRGYGAVGAERVVLIDGDVAKRLPRGTQVRLADADDWEAMHGLYGAHDLRVGRGVEESALLYAAPLMTTLVAMRDGGVAAYACMGRGLDLQGVVHEWAGDDNLVLGLVRSLALEFLSVSSDQPVAVMMPLPDRSLAESLRAHGGAEALGIVGMARLLSLDAGGELLRRMLPEATVEVEEGRGLRVHGPEGYCELDARGALEILWPARGECDALHALQAETGLARVEIRPWYIWGLDSI